LSEHRTTHTGLAVGEWHIHAWDLAQSAGCRPATIRRCNCRCWPQHSLAAPIQREADPWLAAPRNPLQRHDLAGEPLADIPQRSSAVAALSAQALSRRMYWLSEARERCRVWWAMARSDAPRWDA